jgi:hypothetical protein
MYASARRVIARLASGLFLSSLRKLFRVSPPHASTILRTLILEFFGHELNTPPRRKGAKLGLLVF